MMLCRDQVTYLPGGQAGVGNGVGYWVGNVVGYGVGYGVGYVVGYAVGDEVTQTIPLVVAPTTPSNSVIESSNWQISIWKSGDTSIFTLTNWPEFCKLSFL